MRCSIVAATFVLWAHCSAEGATTSNNTQRPLSSGAGAGAQGGAGGDAALGDASSGGDLCADAIVQAVVARTNEERAGAGLTPLQCHSVASHVALGHSIDMCDHQDLSHDSSDGTHFDERLRAGGVTFTAAGENVAQGAASPDDVVALWMSSAGHRANILSVDFANVGVGYVACAGAHYWTQVFFK